ncbi:MAG TPA: prolipoprotein diacylglyceryl transferase family protein [Burkholderiaceae bacterium]|nr:prolipoprotein diacylglyceryl transferase family protein [Burkholderiaceae bacterium]
MTDRLGKIAYGALFCVALPALLAAWAYRLDSSATQVWPQPFPAWTGVGACGVAMALMAVAMRALWVDGGGLPMNAYPPPRRVSGSVYALVEHPIYLAFVMACAGLAVALDSPAGLWIVTPCAALAAMALVVGHEGPQLRVRFGVPSRAPWVGAPLPGSVRPNRRSRAGATMAALAPWVLVYSTFSFMPAPLGASEWRMAWETNVPRPEWALWLYSAAYPMAAIAPLTAATSTDLRRFVHAAWWMSALGFFAMLVVPGKAAYLPGEYSPVGRWLADANRALDADWLACPSFHVAWAVLACEALAATWPRLRLAWRLCAAAIGASCVLTGTHALVDVAAGAALGLLAWRHQAAWQATVAVGERIANSWACVRVGTLRVINHALWSALSASAGTLLALYFAGPASLAPCAITLVAGFAGAAAWGQFVEGGGRLSRPFGYYGFLCGAVIALSVMVAMNAADGRLVAALAAAAPLAQGIGRLRCMVQGCCHGRAVTGAAGWRIVHPSSRVVALAGLRGVPIHPTPLYSVMANAVIAAVLLRLWRTGADWTLIAGLYLVLSSLARFAEEQYRGEPQTPCWHGLPVYQWLAVAGALAGVLLSMVRGATVQAVAWLSMPSVGLAVGMGLLAAALMSVDAPGSKRRFSRLTVDAADAQAPASCIASP